MAFFDDMTAALQIYPETSVVLAIVDVAFPGDVLNTTETATFRVQATNLGPLELTNVTLRITGLNGATVANNGAAAPFVAEYVTQELPTIGGHGGVQQTVGSPLKFKAPAGAQPSKILVSAALEGWNANLNHILIGHSDPLATVKATYAAPVGAL
jgi:hypothetical protein